MGIIFKEDKSSDKFNFIKSNKSPKKSFKRKFLDDIVLFSEMFYYTANQFTFKNKRFKKEIITNDLIDVTKNFKKCTSIKCNLINKIKPQLKIRKKLKNKLNSRSQMNLANLKIFDLDSIHKFKFELLFNRIFSNLKNSQQNQLWLTNKKNVLNLKQLFCFDELILEKSLNKLIKKSLIGKGSFGKVFRAEYDNILYAIKICYSFYDINGEQNALLLNDHINIVKTHHILKFKIANDKKASIHIENDFPIIINSNISYHTIKHIRDLNLLKLISVFPRNQINSTLNIIIMELAGDISLQQLIDDHTNQIISYQRRINLARQICNALVYLKIKSIAHLDLKPANIMIRKSDDLLKLIDFGCSRKNYNDFRENNFDFLFKNSSLKRNQDILKSNQNCQFNENKIFNFENYFFSFDNKEMNNKKLNRNEMFNYNIGTIPYTAPEILNRTIKNFHQADIYSFAIILWQLITREIPYKGENVHSIIYRVVSEKLRPKFNSLFNLEERDHYELIINCWNNQPEKRPIIEWISENYFC